MKKEIYQEIEIPEGVEAEIEASVLKIKGQEGVIEKKFNTVNIDFKKEGKKIIIGNRKATKREKKKINSIASHIKNMILGVQKKFEYQLKICFSHFPITVEINGNEAVIKNFLGEKFSRKMKFPKSADVKVEKDIIKVVSANKELAGQVAANFEALTKVRNRDRRIFQDGIFIVNKAGRKI